jgi:hypothetical protein
MWSEWLVRTLKPRRGEPDARPRQPGDAASPGVPDLEGDGMHPGADDFRSALTKPEARAE